MWALKRGYSGSEVQVEEFSTMSEALAELGEWLVAILAYSEERPATVTSMGGYAVRIERPGLSRLTMWLEER